jgi:hypothetical protein
VVVVLASFDGQVVVAISRGFGKMVFSSLMVVVLDGANGFWRK